LQDSTNTAAATAGACSTAYPAAEASLLATDLRSHRASVLQSLPKRRSWLSWRLQQLLACGACAAAAAAADVSCVGAPAGIAAADGSAEQEQVVLLLSLAKTALNDASEVHTGILQAAYCAFTGGWCAAAYLYFFVQFHKYS
jgi:alkylhydroperoxidase/carboxymuconolactone decarboxylase family protein YurZ